MHDFIKAYAIVHCEFEIRIFSTHRVFLTPNPDKQIKPMNKSKLENRLVRFSVTIIGMTKEMVDAFEAQHLSK